MLWLKDPHKWQELPLLEKLELIRKHLCTGPCGQSHSIMCTRSAIESTLQQAKKVISDSGQ